jgi:limonene-1,2-epoxide hydrolase
VRETAAPKKDAAMTRSATEVVTSFLADCGNGRAAMREAFRSYFTPSTVYENVGMSVTTGADGALEWMEKAEAAAGVPADITFRADIIAIAERGNTVLTERIDHIIDGTGAILEDVRVMGVFEVEAGRITAWRDYFDTAGLKIGGPRSS